MRRPLGRGFLFHERGNPAKVLRKEKPTYHKKSLAAKSQKVCCLISLSTFFSIGLVNSYLGKGEGKSKFRDFFTDNAFVADLTTANISVEKLYVRHRLQMTKHLS